MTDRRRDRRDGRGDQTVPRRHRAQPRVRGLSPRRGARGRRRERRRQVDADERAGGRISAQRGRDPDRREAGPFRVAAGQPRRGNRRGLSGTRPLPDHDRRGKRDDGGDGGGAGGLVRPQAADARGDARGAPAARDAEARSRREDRAPVGGRDATRRDRCGRSSAGARPRARRAELRDLQARKRAAVRRRPPASKRRGREWCTFPIAFRRCSIWRTASRSCAMAGWSRRWRTGA